MRLSIEDMAIRYLSLLVFASLFSSQVGAVLLASPGMLLDLKLLVTGPRRFVAP